MLDGALLAALVDPGRSAFHERPDDPRHLAGFLRRVIVGTGVVGREKAHARSAERLGAIERLTAQARSRLQPPLVEGS
jgi:hypothetical protein